MRGELQQTHLLRVVVKTVTFDIDTDRLAARKLVDELVELVIGTNPSHRHGHPYSTA